MIVITACEIKTLHLRFSRFLSTFRLISVEDGLRPEREELHTVVEHKDNIIDAQEKRSESVDTANVRLIAALSSLKDRYQHAGINGVNGGPTKLTLADASQFKSSSC